ncbi:MAG: LpxI family protein, partial [Blastocatellia bacterium]
KLIRYFKSEDVTHAIMAGQVKHRQIFRISALPDLKMARLLARLAKRNTDSLIGAVAEELGRNGITVIDSTAFLSPFIAREGVITRRQPSKDEQADIDCGLAVAGEIARLDIGQTVAIKDRAVVAVEAMEGTDEVIRRAGHLTNGRSFVVVKVAKPGQDMRFDVPVIGNATIEVMRDAGATAICVTADKTLLFERDELISTAERHGISITASRQDETC